MRVQLRIVAGSLRGRKILCQVHPGLRPTPQMVREALFSILGNAVPNRPFVDVFAGTGANGMEALSRGASYAYFIERDFRLAQDIDDHLKRFGVADIIDCNGCVSSPRAFHKFHQRLSQEVVARDN